MSEEQIAHDLDFKRGAISKLARARAETVHFQTAMLVDGLRALEQAGSGPELRTAAENVRIRAELTLRLLIEVMSYGAQLAGIGTGHEVLEAVHSGELLQL